MKKITALSIIVLLTTIQFIQAQNFKRIEVLNKDQHTINRLANEGIDLRCGAKLHDHGLTIELHDEDIKRLDASGISYRVLIEDMATFYRERAEKELPHAKQLLEIEKAKKYINIQNTQRASISSTIIDNFLQYQGCDELDWNVPNNFDLGSMGGCLTLQQTMDALDDMHNLYPNLISARQDASPTGKKTWGNPSSTITNNGLTYNGTGTGSRRFDPQTIYYVRITGNQASPEGSKPQILYTSMIHSRELSSLMGNIYFMWYLLENYNTDPAIKNLVDNNELYFVPVVNPDGLRWNQLTNPSGGGMQRRNLRPYNGTTNASRGVDLNRNFNYFWGSAGSGSSGTSTSDSYRGPSAFSEPETQIMRDFILARNFKTAVWQHSYANAIPHPYGGRNLDVSGRENEMHQWHEDMTRYNRYLYGARVLSSANGIADDWMIGGATDGNGSSGSGQHILATTPENGSYGEGGFWPSISNIIPIAKRMVRINLMNAYYGGRYAKFHDQTQSDITSLTSNLKFGIERIGQTASSFKLTVTPISSNIVSITSPATQTGMTVTEQRNVTAQLELNPSILPNEKIEYKVTLEDNAGNVFFEADFEKYYQPTVLLSDNPDTDLTNNWSISGNWNATTTSSWSGSRSIRSTSSSSYSNDNTSVATTNSTYDFSNSEKILIQFYAKWDIERNYDFVELLGSTNGSTWYPICGKYTKPNSSTSTNDGSYRSTNSSTTNFQNSQSSGQIYDGDRFNNWVMEEVVIDENNNTFLLNAENARFRFRFRSDYSNNPEQENYSRNFDGFYFDDFKIIKIQELSNPPTAACQNITIQLDATGNATIAATDVNNGSTDDVAITNYSIDIDTFDCSNVGTPVDVTLTVTDGDGQTDSCIATVTVNRLDEPTAVNCWDYFVYNDTTCMWENQGSQDPEPATECWETATFNDTTCSWDVTGTQPAEPATECWETATFNDATCSWDVTGTQPAEPTTECWETATFNDTTCSWDVTGTQPAEPTTECWETATFNDTTCSWEVTGTQPAEPTTECWETATFNDTTCSWDVTGTQPAEPTTECWETATFNDTTCFWDVTGTQPAEPTTECWETATFNDATCSWDVTGTQPAEPTTECWETATFNDTTCFWDVTGTQPAEPATECWETATFNDATCSWDVTGTQPAEPTTECWETATFNDTTCSWDVTGTQPAEPTTECWETATFNDATCSWDVTGTQPAEPATECWETATFNDATCSWDVTGTQPAEPTTECWETATFNDTTCSWDVTGTQPAEPTTECWETATFNDTTCSWEVTGTQPAEPTTECWETATFNDTTCSWDVTGTQPAEPATECWETATFNDTTCFWDVTGTQPAEPTTECWETATFNDTTCSWDVTGTQPAEPTTECWETATFNDTTCSWEVTGTQPAEPTTECWETATFNDTTCSWEVTGTQPAEPATECWETATFNNNTCAWVVTNDGDNVDPICNVQDILIELDQFGNATITANQIDNGSTDNCGIESITVNPSSFNSSDIGANIVEFAVTDYSGNTSYCNATVTVMQNTLGNTVFDYEKVNIQPNPFNSHLIINLPVISSNDEFKIRIFDLNGRLVYNKFLSTVNGKININGLDNLEQAPYFIKITNLKDGHTIIKKLIKF